MKFSVIVPVYNTEKYLERCLESVLNQSYSNYEVIVINDGSTDNSKEVLSRYSKNEKITIIEQENRGLSYSRNVGVDRASGDYILFLDSDDYYSDGLFEQLAKVIDGEDMIKIAYGEKRDGEITRKESIEFFKADGKDAFRKLLDSRVMFEMAWLYAYRKDYIKENKFTVGKYHEDLGLIPVLINNSKCISSIDYMGYIYERDNESSITAFTNEEKELKKAMDTLFFYEEVREKYTDKYLLSFYANACYTRIKNLSGQNKKKYTRELYEKRVYDCLLDDSIKRKVKKTVYKSFYR